MYIYFMAVKTKSFFGWKVVCFCVMPALNHQNTGSLNCRLSWLAIAQMSTPFILNFMCQVHCIHIFMASKILFPNLQQACGMLATIVLYATKVSLEYLVDHKVRVKVLLLSADSVHGWFDISRGSCFDLYSHKILFRLLAKWCLSVSLHYIMSVMLF